MSTTLPTLWGIHAGATGDADALFLKRKYIAVGWHQCGNLSQLAPDREAFKKKIAETYPGKKAGAIPNNAGQLFRFVHEMAIGDFVIYPSKGDRQIHIGRIAGPYKFDPNLEPGCPNLRAVEW